MDQATDKNAGGLADLRERIDALDGRIVDLLNQRAAISLAVGRVKSDAQEQIFKPFREKDLLTRLVRDNPGPLPEKHLRAIYREILSSSRTLQRPERVVFLGPEGTFSHLAAQEYLGHSAQLTPKTTFEEIFRAVSEGAAELGVIPLENSLQGTVGQNVDLFMHYPVHIQAELYCRISHSLMSRAVSLDKVTSVSSHPKALEQCMHWLTEHLPKARLVPENSTAAAAEQAARDDSGAAVVGSAQLAAMHGLNVLAEHIEDLPDNWTRFLVIGSAPSQGGNRDKTSILFTTPDRPGALAEVLNTLAVRGINLTKLESRPFRGERWKYVFFADVECDLSKAEYDSVLAQLRDKCHTLRVLGSYPAGPHLETMG